jgi:hypothetical protein
LCARPSLSIPFPVSPMSFWMPSARRLLAQWLIGVGLVLVLHELRVRWGVQEQWVVHVPRDLGILLLGVILGTLLSLFSFFLAADSLHKPSDLLVSSFSPNL